jgi:hypothetical protein
VPEDGIAEAAAPATPSWQYCQCAIHQIGSDRLLAVSPLAAQTSPEAQDSSGAGGFTTRSVELRSSAAVSTGSSHTGGFSDPSLLVKFVDMMGESSARATAGLTRSPTESTDHR